MSAHTLLQLLDDSQAIALGQGDHGMLDGILGLDKIDVPTLLQRQPGILFSQAALFESVNKRWTPEVSFQTKRGSRTNFA